MFQDIINPARFTEIIGQVRMCSDADVDEIFDFAPPGTRLMIAS